MEENKQNISVKNHDEKIGLMGVTSMIMGILSICSLGGITGIFFLTSWSLFLSVPSLVLGMIAKKEGETYFPKIGIVTSIVSIIITLACIVAAMIFACVFDWNTLFGSIFGF